MKPSAIRRLATVSAAPDGAPLIRGRRWKEPLGSALRDGDVVDTRTADINHQRLAPLVLTPRLSCLAPTRGHVLDLLLPTGTTHPGFGFSECSRGGACPTTQVHCPDSSSPVCQWMREWR
ncbi:hypothetical protein VTN02DRAFT_5116 [Thermoascus thermophilus]